MNVILPYSHSAGDVLMMKPQNIASAVDEFIDLMQLNPDQKFTLEQNDEGNNEIRVLCVDLCKILLC